MIRQLPTSSYINTTMISNARKRVVIASEMGYTVLDNGQVYYKKLNRYVNARHKSVRKNRHDLPYLIFSIKIDKVAMPVHIHQLQAYQKYGNGWLLDPLMVVRHKNSNHLDNSVENILIGTTKDNYDDVPEHVNKLRRRKAARVTRKLSDSDIDDLRSKRELGASYAQLMAEYGIAKSTVSYIVNKKTYNSPNLTDEEVNTVLD